MAKKVAEIMVESLLAANVKRIYGIVGDSLNGFTDALRRVEVLVYRQELSMPPTITLEQAKGFTLYMVRAVLSGRGDEVLDLAQTNLLR